MTTAVYVVGAVRTPIGKFRGGLAGVRPDDLAAHTIKNLLARCGVEGGQVEDIFLGCTNQGGEDNRDVARMAAILAGLPYEVPGVTVNRLCASGLEAVNQAARAILLGDLDLAVAGGVESMTRAPLAMAKPDVPFVSGHQTLYDTTLGWRFPNPKMEKLFPLEPLGGTAENIAERWPITREAQDAFAVSSHQKAVAAQEAGRFDDELLAVPVPQPKGEPVLFSRDEGPRADTSVVALGKLKPAFRAGGSVTAGNSSTLNDGACALLLASEARVKSLGLTPLARYVGSAVAGVDPQIMGIGPVPATRKLLQRHGLTVQDLDLIEFNEAFAAQALAVVRDLDVDPARVNVNGGAIALGHPLGCSGARIVATLAHELRRRPQARYGLTSLCVGVGQGVSTLWERA
jgi:acetyl-CoA acyltransferase